MALLYDGFSQARQRRYVQYTDQHGRKWGANIEIATGDPTGHWDSPSAPIVPDSQYLKRGTDPARPYDLLIDYDRIIADKREALKEWDANADIQRMHKPDITPLMLEKLLGPRPPAVEPWIAARQGDKWTLGLTDRVNLKVAAFLDLEKKDKADDYDFTAEENYLDVEEDADREALGGKRIPVSQRKKPIKPAEEAA